MPPPYLFTASVAFLITDPSSPPPPQQDTDSLRAHHAHTQSQKKKRTSGLDLLRPKSSHGSTRPGQLSPQSISPVSPSVIPSPVVNFGLPPVDSFKRDEVDAFGAQRATLRHTKSIPQILPLEQPQKSSNDRKRRRSHHWKNGTVELDLDGTGGRHGGELKIYTPDGVVLRQPFHPLRQQTVSCEDVDMVHHSVYGRLHTLSFRLPYTEPVPQTPTPLSEDPPTVAPSLRKSTSRGRSLRPNIVSPLSLITRARGSTISHPDSTSASAQLDRLRDITRPSHPPVLGVSSAGSFSSFSEADGDTGDVKVLLAFGSEHARGEWYALLRAFACEDTPRVLRRLHLKVLDLQEAVALSSGRLQGSGVGEEGASSQHGTASIEVRSAKSGEAPSTTGRSQVKLGWASKEVLCVEIHIDNRMIGRTTWAKAEEGSLIPFWAEHFDFEDLPPFTTCLLKICRLRSNKSQPVATVALPLVPSFSKVRDERYPVRSLVVDSTIGELRMSVAYHEVPVLPRAEHNSAYIFDGASGTRMVYYLSAQGYLDQIISVITKTGIARDPTLPWLLDMIEVEAKASGNTLFRSNTPLTRTLEAAMRLVCIDFLRLSIGPTVTTVLKNDIAVRPEDTGTMEKLAQQCWDDMYSQRGSVLRTVFAKLFKSVKENHEERKLHYKAVSSFLFLRLIGPALMRPHLFDLARGLPRAGVQRTLTLLAKILHAMAFFSYRDTSRDSEVGAYAKFIKDADDSGVMVDYLSSFATPLDAYQALPPPPTPIETFLSERMPLLTPTQNSWIPLLTAAGPIDLLADGAVMLEALYQRRKGLRGEEVGDEEVKERLGEMDRLLRRFHRKVFQWEGRQSRIEEDRSHTPRPSLHIDVPAAQRDRSKPKISSPSSWKWIGFGWMSPAARPPDSGVSGNGRAFSPPPSIGQVMPPLKSGRRRPSLPTINTGQSKGADDPGMPRTSVDE
ncbi:hypothetical protein IAT38_004240 [Cryptococcus sp. DSM 104549]